MMLTQTNPKFQQILTTAQQLLDKQPDWVVFFKEILGIQGIARSTLSNPEYIEFQQSQEFQEIQQTINKLRNKRIYKNSEIGNVITVRLPECLHQALKDEAERLQTSMNKLCITKLLQVINDKIPN